MKKKIKLLFSKSLDQKCALHFFDKVRKQLMEKNNMRKGKASLVYLVNQ